MATLPRYRCALALGVACCVWSCEARAAESLAEVVRATRVEVANVDDAVLASVRTDLANSLAALETKIGPGSRLLEGWKRYLDWDVLTAFASGDASAKLTELQAVVERLSSGQPGLEIDAFQAVHRDARRLFDLLLVSTLPDANAFVTNQAEQLAALLEQDPTLLDPRGSFAVEQRLDLFQGIDGARPIAQQVLEHFDGSNLYVNASSALINRAAGQPVREQRPVSEVILGTNIRGTGDTSGWLSVSLLPSAESARLMFHLTGDIAGSTLGVNGPACIRSSSQTSFSGGKQVVLTRDAFSVLSANFSASTRSRTRSVSKRGGGFGEKIVVAVAKRQIAEKKACADSIAGQRAALRLEEGFNKRVNRELSQARRRFEQELLAPFERRHAPAQRIRFCTSSDELELEMLQAARGQLAADTQPRPAPAADLAVRVHQSGANNFATAILGGATLSKDSANEPAKIDVPMPAWAEQLAGRPNRTPEVDPAAFKPWRLTFRRARPLSFRFDAGEVDVLLHVARMQVGEDGFDNWDVILKFRVVQVDGEWMLERVGEVDALPTGFDPASGRGLRGAQVGFRANLKKQLNQQVDGKSALPVEIPLRPVALRNGRGTLTASDLMSDAGWLSLAWALQ